MTVADFYKWLKKDWAKTGSILSIFLFVFLFIFVRKYDIVIFVLLLQTPLYMLHQAEEYIFPGGFGKFFNTQIFKLNTEDKPLDQNFIFFINVILIWIILPLFGLLSIIDYQYGLWIPYFSFFAGIAHVLLAIKAGNSSNICRMPGKQLHIPVGLWSIFFLINNGVLNNFFLNFHIIIGLGLNALLPIMGVILYRNYQKSN